MAKPAAVVRSVQKGKGMKRRGERRGGGGGGRGKGLERNEWGKGRGE